MGNMECRECEVQPTKDYPIGAAGYFASLKDIEERFRRYAQSNMLEHFDERSRTAIERLFTLGQQHICDQLIALTYSKKYEQKDQLLRDIEGINLEELDHLTLVDHIPEKAVASSIHEASFIFEQEDLHTTSDWKEKKQPALSHSLRIVNKYGLKKQQIDDALGRAVVAEGQLAVLVTIECFNGVGVLSNSLLPSAKSPFQMFLEKMEGFNTQNGCKLKLICIVNPKYEREFDCIIKSFQKKNQSVDFSQLEDSYMNSRINYVKYLYPCYPCVSASRLIQTEADRIKFNYLGGDIIGFILRHQELQILLEKYQFMQVANVNNLLERLADKTVLQMLASDREVQIAAMAISEEELTATGNSLRVKEGFVEKFSAFGHVRSYELTHSFILRTALLTSRGKSFQKLISTRIKSESVGNQQFNFSRTFDNILYAPFTVLVVVQKSEFCHTPRPHVEFSNYCKTILGITDTKEDELVEIEPQLLYGERPKLQEIIKELKNLPAIGFPLLISKQKIQQEESNRETEEQK